AGVKAIVLLGRAKGDEGPYRRLGEEVRGRLQTVAPDLADGRWDFKSMAVDGAGNEEAVVDKPPRDYVKDRTAPVITLDNFRDRKMRFGGEASELAWRVEDQNLGANAVTIWFNAGTGYLPIAIGQPATGKFSWTMPRVDAKECRVKVTATDLFGNEGAAVSEPFPVQGDLPQAVLSRVTIEGTRTLFEYRILNEGILTPRTVELWLRERSRGAPWKLAEGAIVDLANSRINPGMSLPNIEYVSRVRTREGVDEPAPEAQTAAEVSFFQLNPGYSARLAGLFKDGEPIPPGTALPGGARIVVRWDPVIAELPRSDFKVRFSLSVDGGRTWPEKCQSPFIASVKGENPREPNSAEFTLPGGPGNPEETHNRVIFRLETVTNFYPDTPGFSYVPNPFTIDSAPPEVKVQAPPSLKAAVSRLPVLGFDPGGGRIKSVALFHRRQGQAAWQRGDDLPYKTEAPEAVLTLPAADADGAYELYVTGVDAQGNGSAPPPVEYTEADRANPAHPASRVARTVVDTQPPRLTLDAPKGGERRRAGESTRVAWAGADPNLADTPYSLAYSADGGQTWTDIIVGMPSDVSTYDWRIPASAPPSSVYRLRVSAADRAGNVVTAETAATFTVASAVQTRAAAVSASDPRQVPVDVFYEYADRDPTIPVKRVTLYTRKAGETWQEYPVPDENFESPLKFNPGSPGYYDLTIVVATAEGAEDPPQEADAGEVQRQLIDWEGPVCNIQAGPDSAKPRASDLTLTWEVKDAFLDEKSIAIDVSDETAGAQWQPLIATAERSGSRAVRAPDRSGSVKYRLRARDLLGNEGQDSVTVNVQDLPRVALSIADGRKSFKPGDPIVLEWNVETPRAELQRTPYRLFQSLDGGQTWELYNESRLWDAAQASAKIPAPNAESVNFQLRLVVENQARLAGEARTPALEVLKVAPIAEITGPRRWTEAGPAPLAWRMSRGGDRTEYLNLYYRHKAPGITSEWKPWRPYTAGRAVEPMRIEYRADGKPLPFDPEERDGLYGFKLVAYDRVGNHIPLPTGEAPADFILDLKREPVTVSPAPLARAHFTRTKQWVTWVAPDPDLPDRPIDILFTDRWRDHMPDDEWQVVAVDLPNEARERPDYENTGQFLWEVPDVESDQCALRIRARDKRERGAISSRDTPVLAITRPRYAIWPDFHEYRTRDVGAAVGFGIRAEIDPRITQRFPGLLKSTPRIATVSIWYRRSGADDPYRRLAPRAVTSTAGSVGFFPPEGDGAYDIILSAEDIVGNTSPLPDAHARPQAVAIIDTRDPVVTLIDKTTVWNQGFVTAPRTGRRMLRWFVEDSGAVLPARPVRIRYSSQGGVGPWREVTVRGPDGETVDAFPAGTREKPESIDFELPVVGGEYRIRVIATDAVGRTGFDENSRSFRVDRDPPRARVLGPRFVTRYQLKDPNPFAPGRAPQVRFDVNYEAADDLSQVAEVYVVLLKRSPPGAVGGRGAVLAFARDDDVLSPCAVDLSDPQYRDGEYLIACVARDASGNFSLSPGALRSPPLAPAGAAEAASDPDRAMDWDELIRLVRARADQAPATLEAMFTHSLSVDLTPLQVRLHPFPDPTSHPDFIVTGGVAYPLRYQVTAPAVTDVVLRLEYSLDAGNTWQFERGEGRGERWYRRGARLADAAGEFNWFAPLVTTRGRTAQLRLVAALMAQVLPDPYAADAATAPGADHPNYRLIHRSTEPAMSSLFQIDSARPVVAAVPAPAPPPPEMGARPGEKGRHYADLLAKGRQDIALGRTESAVRLLRQAAAEPEADAEGLMLLARALRLSRSADVEEMRRLLRFALRLSAGFGAAHYELGLHAFNESDWEEAREQFVRALDADADNTEYRTWLGVTLYRRARPGDMQMASVHFRAVLAREPDNLTVLRFYRAATARLGFADEVERADRAIAAAEGVPKGE
ncbi:MAG: hypothetical protein HY719_09690, partial [Planctomycetes bacterium]|nr:hypothetical protein [Planctomycetota bacterium]